MPARAAISSSEARWNPLWAITAAAASTSLATVSRRLRLAGGGWAFATAVIATRNILQSMKYRAVYSAWSPRMEPDRRHVLAGLGIVALTPVPALARPSGPAMWKVRRRDATVFLFGDNPNQRVPWRS